VKEFCVFAANYIWPQHTMTGEQLVLVLRPEPGQTVNDALVKELSRRNSQLLNYKRVAGYVVWDQDFTRNAAMKIRRVVLAGQIGKQLERGAIVPL
jgi:long-chain acyl-CoA synthetase